MKWTITMHGFEYDVVHDIPFESQQVVYYAHKEKWWKKNSKWVVSVCVVTGVWGTNTYGVILDNDNHISECEFDKIFINKEDAIEFCIKKNEHTKVKVIGG